ncbi:hypothetical protein [Paludisphaera soli]|uniref:hypothetical protein n=1 Tax=Paludisphaera soli TaxID=2712865 RepID=UPI0013EB3332|nr:hypothetical protein [Paludisphaera soli]
MWETFTRELGGRGTASLVAFILGWATGRLLGRWRRIRQRRLILRGDARDTVVIEHHIVEAVCSPDPERPGCTKPMPGVLRIRALGQDELRRVIPNGHLAEEFLARAWKVTPERTLISMAGAEGSYLLETLTGFVGDRAGGGLCFDHDLYVMAPCCEPSELAHHQPITVVLIAVDDLALFDSWSSCRGVRVEHGGDGTRVLTLMALARRRREEQARIDLLRREGRPSRYAETMYVLDLALDRRTCPVPTRTVPWERHADVLRRMGLESIAQMTSESCGAMETKTGSAIAPTAPPGP